MALGALPVPVRGDWTIYDKDGNPAVPFDCFYSASIKAEAKIATSPVEKGQFAAYNKSSSPDTVSIILSRTGPKDKLAEMLNSLSRLRDGTDLVSVVTPEKTFMDYSLEAFDYTRSSDTGTDRLLVSLRLVEIRQVTPEYSNETLPKKSADTSDKSAGKQQSGDSDDATKNRAKRKSVARRIGDWGRS